MKKMAKIPKNSILAQQSDNWKYWLRLTIMENELSNIQLLWGVELTDRQALHRQKIKIFWTSILSKRNLLLTAQVCASL